MSESRGAFISVRRGDFIGIRNQLDAAQAAARELAQELDPERLGLR